MGDKMPMKLLILSKCGEINQKYNEKCRQSNQAYFKIAYSSKIAVTSIKSKTKSADEPIKCGYNAKMVLNTPTIPDADNQHSLLSIF